MLVEYIGAALARGRYEIIDDEEPYYGEIPELKGIWPLEKHLKSAAKDYPRLSKGGSL